MENHISIGKAAKYLGVSINTLRVWEKKKILVPERTPTGHRRYKMSQVESFEGKKYSRIQNTVFLYARVSTQKQADAGNLDRQIRRLTEYASNNKYAIQAVFRDIANGLNENRKGLQKLLKAVKETNNALVIIEYKDRLARFGYAYLEKYISDFGGHIVVIEKKDVDEQQELVEDLIAVTTSFSARIYGKSGGRVAKKLSKVIESEVTASEDNGDGDNPGTDS
ncbi:regulatory protein MerR [Desulfofarcimen acetoxidans DSM 771]|uniref:Regulatory protein MerR n=1 Tax=Desulfofarcimen acetoxidans (strain ATCC 49208 / DSM 771 / KCTC 5769 / VKM B-1644 / 5575) TaxID=485916 RepID=C8W292_DESAS|nr:IS607 family transposase [Desulfofarcimen acetoxidans]ACV61756.1 regulatory protein MerR [Desulfofarcimen acetoxidans DSM 771]